MTRCAASVLLLAFGVVFQLSHGLQVNVTNSKGELCLYANLMVNFSVSYEVAADKNETAVFELPGKVTTVGSLCDNSSSTLQLNFGDGHFLSVKFTLSGLMYQADSVIFSYNLSDSSLFPKSISNETASVTVTPQITDIGLDTCYSCKSKDTILSSLVNMTLSDVLMQAFVINGSKSDKITSCSADVPTTSAPPTTHSTNVTTEAPVTNTTTTAPPPTTTPTPTLPTPSTWTYSIDAENSTACLLVKFGLRIGFKQGETYTELNLEHNKTKATGLCGVNSTHLQLASDTMNLSFTFTNDSSKFRLHSLNVTVNPSSGGEFIQSNSNLSLWEAAIGSSYMCNKEQNYTITNQLSLYTFNLQVQPFGVVKGDFSTAEECVSDVESFLVPIAVGVALLVLILIVLLAYFIGRKRNMATGYQSFQ
ncbi:lysosome-associated membrane glycoprotein 2 isoform X1 [Solea solea]|uniref:lysosome-associated membrane glycoprotein 2 isoform X1 n=1 Tax=Solea solea TaxID=90069 RepID=UPI00272BE9E1|nr:lysosome-associated membrane glycoprotein 2 isoform X1 [Solea solea]